MKLLLDIKSRPPCPHGKFERPDVARLIDDTIHVDIPDVLMRYQSLGEWQENLLRQFGAGGITHHGALLACCDALVAVHELLKLEILLPGSSPPVGAEPPADPHLDP